MQITNDPASPRVHAPAQEKAQTEPAGLINTESQSQKSLVPALPTIDELAAAIEANPDAINARTMRDAIASVPGARALVLAAAIRCLGAKRLMFDRDTKSVVKVDDGATIMKAVSWMTDYSDGLPVQQNINVNFDANKEMPVKEMLAKSPALLAAVKKMVAEVEAVQKTGAISV